MTWADDIWDIVRRLSESFSLADVYRYRARLAQLHPENHHVEAKIRQQLQVLRDARRIEFVDNAGNYRRVG